MCFRCDNENRKCRVGHGERIRVKKKSDARPARVVLWRIWIGVLHFQCARVVGVYLYEPCTRAARVRTRRPTWNVVRFSLELRARAGRRRREQREGHCALMCACYSSRFLSPRNALAIIAART